MLVVDKQSLVESDYKMKLMEIIKKENKKDAFPQFSQTIVSAFDISTCSPSCLGGIPFG